MRHDANRGEEMSIEAVGWAFKQAIRPSARKFVLVALADNAGDTWEAWPANETICNKTGQDRKTVIRALAELERAGVIKDTGKRMGSTGQVKVWRLIRTSEESRKREPSKGPKNGRKGSQKRDPEESQKRDTEPSGEPGRNHKTPTPSANGTGDLFNLPEFEDPELQRLWTEWVQHRKEKRSALTDTSRKQQLAHLREWGPERAKNALVWSMFNGWTGLYEPKERDLEKMKRSEPTKREPITKETAL